MKRLARIARGSCFPLLALLGIGLIAAGVAAEWRRCGALYVEEEEALAALARDVGGLRYRREGDVRPRTLLAKTLRPLGEPIEAPWSSPFVGRVIYVDASRREADDEPRLLPPYVPPVANEQDGQVRYGVRVVNGVQSMVVLPNSVRFANMSPAQFAQYQKQAAAVTAAATPPTRIATRPSIRERVLRLPGLMGYRDALSSPASGNPVRVETLELGRPLPTLPTGLLHPKHLTEPFPTGQALAADELRRTAKEIAGIWRTPPGDAARMLYAFRNDINLATRVSAKSESLRLIDDDRRLEFDELGEEPSLVAWSLAQGKVPGAPGSGARSRLSIWTEGEVQNFAMTSAERTLASRLSTELREATSEASANPLYAVEGPYGVPAWDARMPESPLGKQGERVVAIERIDRDRLRIEATSENGFDGSAPADERSWTFRAIVRTDLDYAIEQYEYRVVKGARSKVEAVPDRMLFREIRWLSKKRGEPVVVERIFDRLAERDQVGSPSPAAPVVVGGTATHSLVDELGAPPAIFVTHERIATEYDPTYSASALDLKKYDPTEWARPATTPAYRGERILASAGGVCLLIAAIGTIVIRLAAGRRPAGDGRGGRASRLQFGLVTLTAAALFVISAAGWIKQKIDDAEEQSVVLSSIAALDETVVFERREPGWPWLLFSTEAVPLDAPLSRIGMVETPPAEALDPLLTLSPAVAFEADPHATSFPIPTDVLFDAVGTTVPKFEPVEWDQVVNFGEIPRGEPLSTEQGAAAIERMLGDWRRARENRPTRYAMRIDAPVGPVSYGATIRDGERSWTFDGTPGQARIDAGDGTFLRRFVREEGEWILQVRHDRDEPLPPAATYWVRTPSMSAEAPSDEIVLPPPPFATPPELEGLAARLCAELLDGATWQRATVERLDEDRLRLRVERADVRADVENAAADPDDVDPGEPLGRVATWTGVVRTDLDHSVESFDVVEYYDAVKEDELDGWKMDLDPYRIAGERPNGRRLPSAGFPANAYSQPASPSKPSAGTSTAEEPEPELERRRREVRGRQALRRMGTHVILLETQLVGCDLPAEEAFQGTMDRVRYAVDLEPAIEPKLFERPTLAAPDPAVPPPPRFRWFGGTFLAGCFLLLATGARNVVDFWKARRRRRERTRSATLATEDDRTSSSQADGEPIAEGGGSE